MRLAPEHRAAETRGGGVDGDVIFCIVFAAVDVVVAKPPIISAVVLIWQAPVTAVDRRCCRASVVA